jgi:unsaturated rhamnogalacturonyl hydrolase
MFGRHLNSKGEWHQPLQAIDFAMKGYPLLYLVEKTGEECYRRAAYLMADTLLHDYPRTSEGTLLYNQGLEAALVDTVGMVCPFLARYSRLFKCDETLDLCSHQVGCFIHQNLDPDTHLPYHGYYPDGPVRLGMQGWARGTGWYMLGLADALLEMTFENPQRRVLEDAFVSVASSVRKFQRPDGHWGWAMLLRHAHLDSSATAYISYSMLRCVEGGVLDETYMSSIDRAIRALMMVTRGDGLIDGSLSDCLGLGLYPQTFGPQPWLQGMATALGAVYAMRLKCR